jgi:hypothetical protein
MNWEAIGAVAEILASVGVVISLLYLAVQIRAQTIESRLATGNELANQLNVTYSILSSNRDFADVFLRGLQSFPSLDTAERVQFAAHMNRTFRVVEAMFNQYRWRRIDDSVWQGLDAALKDLCTYPGTQAWWSLRKHWFCDEFQAHVLPYMNSEGRVDLYQESLGPR